ncbi:MAG: Tfp pilus assembly protein FimT/FimU [Phycisphaerales bacterium JB039]
MATQRRQQVSRRPQRAGYSLIELAAIVVILAILAAVSAPSLGRIPAIRAGVAAEQIAGDLSFARSWSLATGVRSWVRFDLAAQEYRMLAEDPDIPGRAGAALLQSGAGGPLIVTLDAGQLLGIQIDSADFDGGVEIGCDARGRPLNDAEELLRGAGELRLSTGHIIRVAEQSGITSYVSP